MSSKSIESRVQSYLEKSGNEKVRKALKAKMKYSPDEIANKYISTLQGSIDGNLSYENVAKAISGFEYSYTEGKDGNYIIEINFSKDLSRPSLNPERYGGINNLAALYDKGVGKTMNQVYGEWHGNIVGSRTNINGAGFMEDAKSAFIANYKEKYNIESVEIGSDFYTDN